MFNIIKDIISIVNNFVIKGYNNKIYFCNKQNDTMFIMGTGTTINELTIQQFNQIGECDSFGFNFFIFHDFTPRYYMFEYIKDNKMRRMWNNLINTKYINGNTPELIITSSSSLKKIKIQYKDMLSSIKKISNLKVINIAHVAIRNILSLRILSFFKKFATNNSYIHVRGSLSVILNITIDCEYKNIVFCGIDLDDKGYFYNDLISDSKQCVGMLHSTSISLNNLITMQEYIKYVVMNNKNINFYVSSKNSKLSEFLKVYEWKC